MLVAALILVIFLYFFFGLVLWCLCPDMELLLDLTSGLGAWVHQLVYQLVELLKEGREPMPLGGGLEKVPPADGDILGMSTPLPMNNSGNGEGENNRALGTISGPQGQGQPEQGREAGLLDLNVSADPEVLYPDVYRQSVKDLTKIIAYLQPPSEKEVLFPNYNNTLRVRDNPVVQAAIADFLKKQNLGNFVGKAKCLAGLRKRSPLWSEFEEFMRERQRNQGGGVE
jgi:hypothetical protein